MQTRNVSMARGLVLAALGVLLAACATRPPVPAPTPEELIDRALKDAEQADPDEVVDDLYALNPGSAPMQWRRDEAGDDRVLTVTWTNWEGYRDQLGQTVPVGRTIWVTAAPEVQAFCSASGLQGEALTERLEQFLGLRPGTGKPYFVTMWAKPADMVRPCPDPEVTDGACEAVDEAEDVVIGTHQHRAWFDDLKATSYGPEGYPWTRLGYTYDWNPASPERGASEFLIPAEAMVQVDSFIDTAAYCQ